MRTNWQNEEPGNNHQDNMGYDGARMFLIREVAHGARAVGRCWAIIVTAMFAGAVRSTTTTTIHIHLHTMPGIVAMREYSDRQK
ncbi:hypothetical protein I7I53_06337 [Histoplasma capsulatum var. duboisii H88]|uniref:Uncharacterized protein n=1 Tax=Ajellomyces capsulatus (strain H88) TaxID=544711 RepID=A0A8A1LF80_AJEC8|nr:hypothetical protein I7I53_06337 [Histoplasma capsulatum var. duboisii H88]